MNVAAAVMSRALGPVSLCGLAAHDSPRPLAENAPGLGAQEGGWVFSQTLDAPGYHLVGSHQPGDGPSNPADLEHAVRAQPAI